MDHSRGSSSGGWFEDAIPGTYHSGGIRSLELPRRFSAGSPGSVASTRSLPGSAWCSGRSIASRAAPREAVPFFIGGGPRQPIRLLIGVT